MIRLSTNSQRAVPAIVSLIVVAMLATLASSASAVIQHPNLERGFSADTAFQIGDIDHVNLFNGGLAITIPIGQSYPAGGAFSYQLTLVYTSKLWDWETVCNPTVPPPATGCQHQPKAGFDFNAGLGWILSLGKLVPPNTPDRNETPHWLYVGPDGAEHVLYESLIDGEPLNAGFFYTRDNSFLRLRNLGTSLELHFPDGTVHTFDAVGNIVSMRDIFLNQLTISRSPNGLIWTLADDFRSHTIEFTNQLMDGVSKPLVSRVRLAAFGGSAPADYVFTYAPAAVERPLPYREGDDQGGIPSIPPQATVQILTSLTLPDGSKYEMPRSRHNLTCPTATGCRETGTIARLTLPTQGHIAWEYEPYTFPNGGAQQPSSVGSGPGPAIPFLTVGPGVAKRKLQSRGGADLGVWTYTRRLSLTHT